MLANTCGTSDIDISVVFPIAKRFPPILDLNLVLVVFDSEVDLTDKVIAIHTLSDFGWRFCVPKIRQRKLCHTGRPLTGEDLISKGLLLTGLQTVEKFIKLRIVFSSIVNCSPRNTQVNC